MADPIVLKWEEEGLSSLLRAITELNRSLKRNEEQVQKTDKETQKHEKSQSALTKQARGTAKAMRAFGDSFSGVSSGAGRATRTAGRMLGVFSNMGAAGGAAGLAVAGTAAAMFGLAGASIQAGRAVLDAARNGRELAETFAPYQRQGFVPPVSESSLQSFDRINASFEALEIIGKAVALEIADELAPNIEGLATGAVAVGLYIRDASDGLGEFLQSAYSVVSGLDDLIERQNIFVRGLLVLATGGFSEAVVAAGNYAEGIESAEGSTRDYLDEASGFISSVSEQIKLLKDGESKARGYGRALKEINPILEAEAGLIASITTARQDELSDLDQAALSYAAIVDQIDRYAASAENAALVDQARAEAAARFGRETLAIQQQLATAEDEAAERRRADAASFADDVQKGHKDSVSAAVESASTVTSSFASITSDLSSIVGEEAGRAALAMFRANQAAGIANATVSTFVAATKALELGPIAGPIAAGAIGAAGAANVAAIAAQPPPQVERHMGSPMRGARDPLAPDEVSMGGVRGLRQEGYTPGGVLSSQGVNALNAQRVSDSAQGQAPGAVWKHLGRELPRRIDGGESRTSASVRRAARREQSPSGRRGW